MTLVSMVRRPLGALALVAVLAACGSAPGAQPGNAMDAALARMGEPRARYAVDDGMRLFFALRPGEVDRLDFDADGRLIKRQPALSTAGFEALARRGGDASAVQLEFGPPTRQRVLKDGEGLQWTYSWREYDTWRLAQVWFDKAGVFQRLELLEDPKADDRYL